MDNIAAVSKATEKATFATSVPLYYSYREDAVYTTPGEGRYLMTYLIRRCSPIEIVMAVNHYKDM